MLNSKHYCFLLNNFDYVCVTFNDNLMTKLIKKTTPKNVHTHMTDVWTLIDTYLPRYNYVSRVQKALNKKVAAGTIRNIRSEKQGDLDVIKAILKVALEEKAKVEELSNKVKNN